MYFVLEAVKFYKMLKNYCFAHKVEMKLEDEPPKQQAEKTYKIALFCERKLKVMGPMLHPKTILWGKFWCDKNGPHN